MPYKRTFRPNGRPKGSGRTAAAKLLAGDMRGLPAPAVRHPKARKLGVSQVIEPAAVENIGASSCPKFCGLLPTAQPCGVDHDALDPRPRALRFVEKLTHTKGKWAGQPFAPREWQADILARLFGALQDDKRRQYRTCYIEIPRKNGKTGLRGESSGGGGSVASGYSRTGLGTAHRGRRAFSPRRAPQATQTSAGAGGGS